jgi:hypothetical protein
VTIDSKRVLQAITTQIGLGHILAAIEASDPSADGTTDRADAAQRYAVRTGLVFNALAVAAGYGYPSGIAIDPAEPDWPVAYIDLPTGQVSWHLAAYPGAWDGHDGAAKTERIRAYVEAGRR